MSPNPFLGVFFHWLGGLASGSFYVPYKSVKKWSWETYWLVGGFFSWIICPWALSTLLTNDVVGVLKQQSFTTLWWTYFFGAMWGFGGLTFGLTMRYLGMSLGMGVALGYCAAFGTLLPPIFKSFAPTIPVAETIAQIASTTPGKVTLFGVLVCLIGIGVAALAGLTKEKEMPETEKKKAIAEFNFRKGLLVATFSGIMSACFSFALTAGNPIGEASAAAGTSTLWTGLPKLVVVLLGGFTTNFIWCMILNARNKSFGDYTNKKTPLFKNYLFSAIAGTAWFLQFFFYGMGESKLGNGPSSWILHMAFIILVANMWGLVLKEWKGVHRKTLTVITIGIITILASVVIVGIGNSLR